MIAFREIQKMTQWWLWLLLAGVAGIWVWGIVHQLVMGQPFGNHPLSDAGLLVSSVLPIALLAFFYSLTLYTTVDAKGIQLRYTPLASTHIAWPDIQKAEVIRYGFVGYGIRTSPTYDTIYNAKGNTGLLLYKKSGEKFLLGTQQPEQLAQAVGQFIPISTAAG